MNRRTFLQTTLQAGAGLALATSLLPKALAATHTWLPAHTLPHLPYSDDALAPYIDAETMRIHHSKHHQAYVDNLNKTLSGHADLQDLPVTQLIQRLNQLPADIRTAVRNHGGGHANHSLFWTILTPKPARPSEAMIGHINRSFGTFSQFQTQFEQAAKDVFGSGWAWLVKQDGKLRIVHTANQDSPLMPVNGQPLGTPILGLDVWEHAYYLKYQNKRADYVSAFWSVLNWAEVERRWQQA